MSLLDLLLHLASFAAPALAVGLLLACCARVLMRKQALAQSLWAQVAINFVAGLLALLAGLWFFGSDGKMASYAALVLACATSQWLLLRPWR